MPRMPRLATSLVGLAVLLVAPAAQADPVTELRARRIVLEAGAGTLGLAAGVLGGLVGTCLVGQDQFDDWGCLVPGALAGAALGSAGLAGGVYLAGDSEGADGDVGALIGGEAAGIAVSAAIVGITVAVDPEGDSPVAALALFPPIVGAVLGWELTASPQGSTNK
jgi:hypothetical protein